MVEAEFIYFPLLLILLQVFFVLALLMKAK